MDQALAGRTGEQGGRDLRAALGAGERLAPPPRRPHVGISHRLCYAVAGRAAAWYGPVTRRAAPRLIFQVASAGAAARSARSNCRLPFAGATAAGSLTGTS